MRRVWERLSRRERVLIVVALFALAAVVGRYLVLAPILERREWVKSQVAAQPALLAKSLGYLAQKEEIEKALERAQSELKAADSLLLPGDTPPVSASALQEMLQAFAAKEGVQIITTRVLSPEPAGPFTRIPVQVELGGQLEQMVNLLKALESAEKLLAIQELNLRSLFVPAAAARPPGPAAPAMNLRASVVVSGFVRQSAVPASREGGRSPGEAAGEKKPAEAR
jgi:Tfp pilus assembly protein PilO